MVSLVESLKNVPSAAKANALLSVVMILLGFVMCLLVVVLPMGVLGVSGLSDPNNIRRYVVGSDGQSLDDKLNGNRSGLTGSRDIPVFFQDFDTELTRDAAGNLVNEREGLSGDKDPVSDIEKRFLGA